jgi:FAD/FMN-containing dehydrogenase
MRGGGGNFGIATSFEFRVHPVGQVIGGMVAHTMERARDALKFFRDFALSAPEDLGIMAAFVTGPDGTKLLAIFVCYSGPLAEGERIVAPLRAFGPPLVDQIATMPYLQLQSLLEPGFPPGQQNFWKSNFLREVSDAAIDLLVGLFKRVPSPTSAMAIEYLGGALSRVKADDTAFAHRDELFNLLIVGMWPDPTDNRDHIEWVRKLWQAVQPYSTGGVYVNYLGRNADEEPDRVRAAYGKKKYDRLVELKRRYDPDNIFCLNQNIDPAIRKD